MKKNQIIQGDCLKILRTISDESIDCIITSPPYNLGNNHHTGNTRHYAYFDNYTEVEYQTNQIEVLNELYRITKISGSLFYNHKNRIKDGLSITPYQWLLRSKWLLKQELVWFNGSQNFDKIRFYPMTERIYWMVKTPRTVITNIINHHDLFNWKPEGIDKLHTRTFPEKLVSDLLKCLPEAKHVLDPYCGSGTVCLVAKKMGRTFIGIEISPEYCKIANDRLAQDLLFL